MNAKQRRVELRRLVREVERAGDILRAWASPLGARVCCPRTEAERRALRRMVIASARAIEAQRRRRGRGVGGARCDVLTFTSG